MSTRSMIGRLNNDNTVTAIYCHYDGYPEYNGKMLTTYYNNADLVDQLIALGDISSLRKNISTDKPHDFNNPDPDTTVAYHRDRGEELNKYTYHDINDFMDNARGCWAEYVYVYDNGWHCYNAYSREEISL